MGMTQTAAPSSEPVSLSDAKVHLQFTGTDSNDYISSLITMAREYVEDVTSRQLMNATWQETLDVFPLSGQVLFPSKSPLSSVTSIQYIDDDGDPQTWATADYRVDTSHFTGRITEAFEETYPSTRAVTEAVTLTYIAGYGGATDVPQKFRHAIKMLVGHWFEFREPVVSGMMVTEVPITVKTLLGLGAVVEAR